MRVSEPKRTRSAVAAEYGYPWPWRVRELVEDHAVEGDVDLRDLADRWGCSYRLLGRWVRKHGFRTENYRAKR